MSGFRKLKILLYLLVKSIWFFFNNFFNDFGSLQLVRKVVRAPLANALGTAHLAAGKAVAVELEALALAAFTGFAFLG